MSMRTASAADASSLTALALASKASWGYRAAFMAACADELTVTAQACASGDVRVAVVDGAVAGFHQTSGGAPEGELVHLFVSPAAMGRGVGRFLLDDARRLARARGCRTVLLDADPHAEGFYARFGARTLAAVPSGSIPGRMLPRMMLDIS